MNLEIISSKASQKKFNSHSNKLDISEVEGMQVINIAPETPKSQNPPETLESNALKYDPEKIKAVYSKRPLQVWKRRISILWTFMLFGFSLWLDKVTGNATKHETKRAISLREILTNFGPAFIKVGQALSTRPDLASPTYLDELTKLQDQLPPFPNKVAYHFIEEELGFPPKEIYTELTPNPIAAASLGQVYKGKLKTGETVAVKVQRPGLAESIALIKRVEMLKDSNNSMVI